MVSVKMFLSVVNVFTIMFVQIVGTHVHDDGDNSFTNKLSNQFDMNLALTAILWKPRKTLVSVPLLLRLSLCKITTASHGPAKHELMAALDYSRNKKSSCESELRTLSMLLHESELLLLNKIYVNYSSDFETLFLKDPIGVNVERVPFYRSEPVIDYINDWFAKNTFSRVPEIVSDKDVDQSTSILLVSAAHIQSSWEVAFNILLTSQRTFHGMDNKDWTVDMMTMTDSFLYYSDDAHGFKIVQVRLTSSGLMMTFILPERKQGLSNLLALLYSQPVVLQGAKSKMAHTLLKLSLPKFKVKTIWDWEEVLFKMGIKQVFNVTASGLDALLRTNFHNQAMHLSKVKQRVIFEVDEYGAFRSPQRAREDFERTPDWEMKEGREAVHHQAEFLADHPFLFLLTVRMSPSGDHEELAVGVYYGPD